MIQALTTQILEIINLSACMFLLLTCYMHLSMQSKINEGKLAEVPAPEITVTITFRIAVVTIFEALMQICIMTLHNHQAHVYEVFAGMVMFCIVLLGIFVVCYFQEHRSIKKLINCIFNRNIKSFFI